MIKYTQIRVFCTAETALKKLKRAKIPVSDCKSEGADFIFRIKEKHIKKAFAIFANPCYNIRISGRGSWGRCKNTLFFRPFLFLGGALFIAAALFCNAFVFKISVTGSGSYLEPEVVRIINSSGAKPFKTLASFDKSSATGAILALPQVTFCNISKRGSVLVVDVRVEKENLSFKTDGNLKADRSGTVEKISAVCGTALVSAGDEVASGDILISSEYLSGEERVKGIAVGYAILRCVGKVEYFADCESEQNLKYALASARIAADDIIERSYSVRREEVGVTYVIDFIYLHKLSINLN